MPRWSLLVSLVLVAAWSPARAQSAASPGKDAPIGSLLGGQLSRSLIDPDALAGAGQQPKRAGSTLTRGTTGAARALAASYPADQRAGVEKMFKDLLAGYAKVERALGLTSGDLAGATALFVLASYEAYRDTAVDPSLYQPVIEQMRGAIQSSAAFAEASAPERREAYEQLAILGMFVAAVRHELQSRPDETTARNLRAAAKSYLTQFLGADPDLVEVSASGVRVGGVGGAAGGGGAAGSTASTAEAPPEAPVEVPARSPALAATEKIETVGFYTVTSWNGGFMSQLPTPIVLFKSGDALLEMANLNDPAGLEANKRARPDAWTKWRRAGKRIERRDGNKWVKLEWTATNDRLPRGFRLNRAYQAFSGGGGSWGNTTTSFGSWNNLRFDRSGRFSTDRGGGATTGGVTARSRSGTTGGTYEISGYTLTLRFSDGRTVYRSIVTNPRDPKVIWVDGTSYTSN